MACLGPLIRVLPFKFHWLCWRQLLNVEKNTSNLLQFGMCKPFTQHLMRTTWSRLLGSFRHCESGSLLHHQHHLKSKHRPFAQWIYDTVTWEKMTSEVSFLPSPRDTCLMLFLNIRWERQGDWLSAKKITLGRHSAHELCAADFCGTVSECPTGGKVDLGSWFKGVSAWERHRGRVEWHAIIWRQARSRTSPCGLVSSLRSSLTAHFFFFF